MAVSEEHEARLTEILTKEDADILASEEDVKFLHENKDKLDEFTRNERFKDQIDFTKEIVAEGGTGGGELVLEDVLKKEPADLSDDEQKFLEENKTSLNSDQQKKYGIVTEPEEVEVKVRGGKEKEPEKGEDEDKKKKLKEEEEEEEIDPDVEKVLDKKIAKATAPVAELQNLLQQQRDEAEVINFVREHPEAGKYERALNAYRLHPAYNSVPIKSIFYILAGEDLKRQGAAEALKAKEEADKSGLGGGGRRPTDKGDKGKLPDIGKTVVGSKESQELLQRAMRGELGEEEKEE